MYDIRQFRPMLYTLLLLGFTGYAVAAETLGLWFLAVVGTLLNGYLVRNKTFKPLPRFVANMITLLFAGWMIYRVKGSLGGPTIFAIGEFLTFLQLVKLYEQRGNRDIAQLLVLSLLLMVAAAISTASLLFGLLFVAYLFLSLYCCLLFHLKTESDHARAVMGLDESKINPMTLRQDQRFLSRSMRRLTLVVSTFAIVVGTLIFVAFPRGTGAGMISNLNLKPSQEMTGFSDQISFQDVARITQNEAEIAYVTIKKNNRPWGAAGQVIYLRGSAPDIYVSDPDDPDHWKWIRTTLAPGDPLPSVPPVDGSVDLYTQDIRLEPTGSHTLFAMPGVVSFSSKRPINPTRGAADDVLLTFEPPNSEVNYTVTSTNAGAIPYRDPPNWGGNTPLDQPQHRNYPVPAKVREFAMRDEVSGIDANGNLARQRAGQTRVGPLDEQIAANFEAYLRKNFKYTLDLTDAKLVMNQDPLVQFLYDFKRGHCEYFAGSMALMCQSLGMKARVVVGFKCDEFNSLGGYYVVRQSHAHAWVEVLTLNGWQTFDPTSSNEAAAGPHAESMWQHVRSVMSFLEYKWGNAVVNYDSDSRNNLISNADSGLTSTAVQTSQWASELRDWFNRKTNFFFSNQTNFFAVFSGVLTGLVGVMALTAVVILLYFVYGRLRLRRRAQRIGLQSLPGDEQRRLAKQLAFYDQMLQTLERRKIVRATHLTPREFSASIGFLPSDVFDVVQRLTRIFYRVRYGQTELQPAQQRRLVRSVERLDAVLGPVQS